MMTARERAEAVATAVDNIYLSFPGAGREKAQTVIEKALWEAMENAEDEASPPLPPLADCPYCPPEKGDEVCVACTDLENDELFQVWCPNCWAHGPSCLTREKAIEAWDRVAFMAARGEDDVGPNACFRGNSVGFIHDKMRCYQDQVGMGYEALRALGFDPAASSDNSEMREQLAAWTVEMLAKLGQKPIRAPETSAEVLSGDFSLSRALAGMSKLEVFSMSLRLKAGMEPLPHDEFEEKASQVFGEDWHDDPELG